MSYLNIYKINGSSSDDENSNRNNANNNVNNKQKDYEELLKVN
jgi:hypothetical protein